MRYYIDKLKKHIAVYDDDSILDELTLSNLIECTLPLTAYCNLTADKTLGVVDGVISLNDSYLTELNIILNKEFKESAQSALDYLTGPRGTVLRCFMAGVAFPLEWQQYRLKLVAIINGSDTTSTVLPKPPQNPDGSIAYPSGS